MKKRKSEEDKPVYLQFKTCKAKCLACNECGYFWGPGHDTKEGQHVVFGVYPSAPALRMRPDWNFDRAMICGVVRGPSFYEGYAVLCPVNYSHGDYVVKKGLYYASVFDKHSRFLHEGFETLQGAIDKVEETIKLASESSSVEPDPEPSATLEEWIALLPQNKHNE